MDTRERMTTAWGPSTETLTASNGERRDGRCSAWRDRHTKKAHTVMWCGTQATQRSVSVGDKSDWSLVDHAIFLADVFQGGSAHDGATRPVEPTEWSHAPAWRLYCQKTGCIANRLKKDAAARSKLLHRYLPTATSAKILDGDWFSQSCLKHPSEGRGCHSQDTQSEVSGLNSWYQIHAAQATSWMRARPTAECVTSRDRRAREGECAHPMLGRQGRHFKESHSGVAGPQTGQNELGTASAFVEVENMTTQRSAVQRLISRTSGSAGHGDSHATQASLLGHTLTRLALS
jgi:hypothetical protein